MSSYKDTNITNPGTSTQYGADDMELYARNFNGQTSGLPPVTIKNTAKWGFWDAVFFFRNQADTRNIIIRGPTNNPGTNLDLTLPPITANDVLTSQGVENIFSVKQEFDLGWILKSQTAPGNPAASLQHFYVDSADNRFKRKKSDGSVTDYDTSIAGIPAGSTKQIQYNNGGVSFAAEAGFEYDAAVNEATIPGLTLTENLILSGVISPSQITSDQNNYNPTNLAISTTLRLNTDAARNITGIAAQPSGTVLIIHNVGSFNFTLKDESTSSTTTNRFALAADLTLQPENSAIIRYDGTTTRWRLVSTDGFVAGIALLAAANTFTQEQKIKEDIQDLLFLYRPIDTAESLIDQNFDFNNSSAAETTYVDFRARLKVNTAGSETGEFDINTVIAGTKAVRFRINQLGNLDWGANLRGRFSESGLTAPRIFTLPDVDTKLAGISSVNTFLKGQEIEEDKNTIDQLVLKQKTNVVGDYSVISAQIKNSSSAYFAAGWLKWQLGVNTAGAESTDFSIIVRNAGSSITAFRIKNDGMLECGGPNKRITFDETGLTGAKIFTFANITDIINPKTLSISNPYSGGGTSAVLVRTGIYSAIADTTSEGHLNSGATAIGTGSALNDTTEGRGRAFATGAVANNNAGLRWTTVSFRREWRNYMILRVSFSSTSDIRVFIGWSSDTAEIAGETTLNNFSGCGIGKRTGDTNWFTMRNDGDATEDRVDTGVTFATSAVTIQLELDATSFRSKIGSTTNTAQTTEIPASTTMLAPHVQIETGAGAADKTINIFPIWVTVGGQVMI